MNQWACVCMVGWGYDGFCSSYRYKEYKIKLVKLHKSTSDGVAWVQKCINFIISLFIEMSQQLNKLFVRQGTTLLVYIMAGSNQSVMLRLNFLYIKDFLKFIDNQSSAPWPLMGGNKRGGTGWNIKNSEKHNLIP